MSALRVTYVGGPTAVIDIDGLRFVTDPTFDPAGSDYPTPAYTLHKTQSPALDATSLGRVDAVLLSHDHHFDNLDHAGRALLSHAGTTITTNAGAERLGAGGGGRTTGLLPWESTDVRSDDGQSIRITATPARHGPAGGDRGPVIGFVLERANRASPTIYFSGDTVWFDGVAEVGERFEIDVALLNVGAARVEVAGPHNLTFNAEDVVTLARRWPRTVIVPLHFEGWTHFTEGAAELRAAVDAAGFTSRVRWLQPGTPTDID